MIRERSKSIAWRCTKTFGGPKGVQVNPLNPPSHRPEYDAWFLHVCSWMYTNLPVIWLFAVMANVQLTVDDLQTVTQELQPVAERWKAIGCALVLVRNFLEQLQGMMLCLCPASSENRALNRTGVMRALTGCELHNFPNMILLVLGQCRSIAI